MKHWKSKCRYCCSFCLKLRRWQFWADWMIRTQFPRLIAVDQSKRSVDAPSYFMVWSWSERRNTYRHRTLSRLPEELKTTSENGWEWHLSYLEQDLTYTNCQMDDVLHCFNLKWVNFCEFYTANIILIILSWICSSYIKLVSFRFACKFSLNYIHIENQTAASFNSLLTWSKAFYLTSCLK